MRSMSQHRWFERGAAIGLLLLVGCAKYQPRPLPTAPDLADAPALVAPANQFGLPGLAAHLVPTDGLDEISIVTLAVLNNPDLKAARLQAGVAKAQLLAAGLLPDPQVGLGGAASALNYGYAAGLMEPITAIFVRGAMKAAAREHQSQVNLNILWQEWQIAEQARELFVEARSEPDVEDLLEANRTLLLDRYHQDQTALKRGNVTLPTVSVDLASVADAEASVRQHELKAEATRSALNQLLGLKPDVALKLVGPTSIKPLSEDELKAAIAALPRHRVDLVALQDGYGSQEESVRRAILMQFPSITAGLEQARDPVEGVNSTGVNVNLTLPIFNRNRGQIAIEDATREMLFQTYQAQLDNADTQATQVWRAAQIMRKELNDLDEHLPALAKTASVAEKSYEERNLSAALYVSLKTSLIAQHLAEIRLRRTLDQTQSRLATLLGLPFVTPSVRPGSSTAK